MSNICVAVRRENLDEFISLCNQKLHMTVVFLDYDLFFDLDEALSEFELFIESKPNLEAKVYMMNDDNDMTIGFHRDLTREEMTDLKQIGQETRVYNILFKNFE